MVPLLLSVVARAALACAVAACATPRPADTPPPGAQPTDAAAAGADIRTADDLLAALETADASISTLRADIRFDRVLVVEGDRQRREGTLYFRNGPRLHEARRLGVPPRAFAVHFDSFLVGNRREQRPDIFIFDGEWLVEILPDERLCEKSRVVGPDEDSDPLAIGQGPFPLPIGQRRADILARYEASLLSQDDGLDPEAAAYLAGGRHYQLRLVPRGPDAADADFTEIRIWYTERTLLPRLARAINADGDVSSVLLINLRTGEDLPPAAFDTSVPGEGWDVQIHEWRRPGRRVPAEDGTGAAAPGDTANSR